MLPVIILQHAEAVAPGTIIDYLNDKKMPYEIIHTYDNDNMPIPNEFDSVISLGSNLSVRDYYQYNYLKRTFHFIKELIRLDKKFLGICFSCQMLAKILGAPLVKMPKREIGTKEIEPTDAGRANSLFKNISEKFITFQWHGDNFEIPRECSNLASSSICENQAFQYKKAVGVQFHPEVNLEIVTGWTELFSKDLQELNLAPETVISEFQTQFETIKKFNYRLLDNFFNL